MIGQPVRVYLVDDSAPLREMLAELLAEPGRVEIVGAADSVAQAVADVARLKPDVVVLDLQLRDGDGFEAARALRALPGGAAIRIVLFTNHQSPEFRRRAAGFGIDDYLDKSRDHERLAAMLGGMAGAARR